MKKVNVIGAGLAGSEAAYQLAKRGIQVDLYEMRPKKMTPAHTSGDFAELVCSNSLRGDQLINAVGVLKKELLMLDSIVLQTAYEHAVPAGAALAVDRDGFQKAITEKIKNIELINILNEEVTKIPSGPTIIATGPLTSDDLSYEISNFVQADSLYFYDAAAPIIEKDSINMDEAYFKSRYDKGEASYINCAMEKDQFDNWYDALVQADVVKLREFEKEIFFEGCMPIEEMARRGRQTLTYGPLKPIGLERNSSERPYAVVQLRQDDAKATLYNLVGFQTHLTWPEQKKIIQMIPGLEKANIIRYGVMHRNTFINAPKVLKNTYQSKQREDLFFAGQLSGVEGYVESIASGLNAAINMVRYLNNEPELVFPQETILGSMAHYITATSTKDFQPMNANWGIVKELPNKVRKKDKKEAYATLALKTMEEYIQYHGLNK
ncbi:methylenetetrahydrofolate--tRNA-(uracil(54)-C(5))-methyltransferase (FADH(2)-oxidizing) TrmFO [Mycoplasma sp. P36-A1]|uniref:methylenetetrahydrofolate--tRNA-(uracil(54)- C(5))-methyltransferase (FADH(2)-oxidizing) TrmFO n=1 Tax=Mycoplasma sp. P36-A1 TaxID=3252900 RepID=UPI003C2E881D